MAGGLNRRDAGDLNGREPGAPAGPGSRSLRVAFAPGTQPDAAPAAVDIDPTGAATLEGYPEPARLIPDRPPRARLVLSSGAHDVLLIALPDPRRAASGLRRVEVVVDGWRFEVDVESDARARLRERATSTRADAAKGGPAELRAIIPGRVVSVDVVEGDAVDAGARLLVLEAMKMQNEVRAPRGGKVARVAVGPGQTVELGDVLLVIE